MSIKGMVDAAFQRNTPPTQIDERCGWCPFARNSRDHWAMQMQNDATQALVDKGLASDKGEARRMTICVLEAALGIESHMYDA